MAEKPAAQRAYSGIQPSGVFTLGNYIGAVSRWAPLQDSYDCLYNVADMHAITVKQDPAFLKRASLEAAAMILAAGVDPARSIVFIQSQVPQHAQLAWVLACHTQFGELARMTQFKDKSQKHTDNINAGLFTYPVLMAADILLYNAHVVPVGADQKQHVELARNIAQRFNGVYPQSFVVPAPLIGKQGARLMSLQDPSAKMSKSDGNANAFISMSDEPDTILRKFKKAVTDSEGVVRRDEENKPGVSNLMTIYATLTGKDDAAIEAEFAGKGYGHFKQAVAESVIEAFRPVQAEYRRILADEAALEAILRDGAHRAGAIAQETLSTVYQQVGFAQW